MAKQFAAEDRLRVSPAGMITLPFSALATLGFSAERRPNVDLRVHSNRVEIVPILTKQPHSLKVSPRGLLHLTKEAHNLVTSGKKGRCQLYIEGTTVYLSAAESAQ